jgi:hypothetical protein
MSKIAFQESLISNFINLYQNKDFNVNVGLSTNLNRRTLFETVDIRTKLESKGFHNSYLTMQDTRVLTNKLRAKLEEQGGNQKLIELFQDPNFFYGFISHLEEMDPTKNTNPVSGLTKSKRAKTLFLEELEGSDEYLISNIPQKTIRDELIIFIDNKVGGLDANSKKFLVDNIQTGHLVSVFFLKFLLAFGLKANFSNDPESYRDFTLSFIKQDDNFDPNSAEVQKDLALLTTLAKAILDSDFITSNNPGTTQKIMVEAAKRIVSGKPQGYTQAQFTTDNGGSGIIMRTAGENLDKIIKKLIKKETSTSSYAPFITDFVSSLEPLKNLLLEKANSLSGTLDPKLIKEIKDNAATLGQIIITSQGSLPLYKLIGKNIAGIIEGKAPLTTSPTVVKIEKTRKIKETIDVKQFAKQAVKTIDQIKREIKKAQQKAKQKIVIAKPKVSSRRTTNLTNLQNLINASLIERVKQNMGTGNRRDVLNLRSGRFAESVKVERMSESREGMITAFYSYMKNPYATFSQGGRQDAPKSRDPKLLIARSIREIAATQVANRLRSVSI